MKQNDTIRIKDIIQAFGLLLLGLACFLSFMFINKGSMELSIPMTLVLLAALFGTVFLLVRLKSTKKDQSQMKMWEYIVLLVIYIGFLGLGSLYVFTHFMNLEFVQRQEVVDQSNVYLEKMEDVLNEYDSHIDIVSQEYEREMDSAVKKTKDLIAFKNKYEIDDLKANNKEQYIEAFEDGLYDEFESVKDKAMKYINAAKSNITERWNPLKVPSTYYDLPIQLESIKDELVKLSTISKRGAEDPFKYDLENLTIKDLSNPKLYFGETNWLLTLLLFLILQIMILWPYLFASRSSKMKISGKAGRVEGFEL